MSIYKADENSKNINMIPPIPEQPFGGWFGEIKSLAKSTKESIFPAIDGFANMIHRSAMNVAAGIAQMERDAELEAERWREENYGTVNHVRDTKPTTLQLPALSLPWEIKKVVLSNQSDSNLVLYVEDEAFKGKVMSLATSEETFLEPYGLGEEVDFQLSEERVRLIHRLLTLDENLAASHAKLCGESGIKEALFWKNYFHHCDRLKIEYDDLIDIDVSSRCSSTLGSLIPTGDVDDAMNQSELVDDGYQPSDNSYVCVRHGIASPPSSLNTLTDTLSVGDLVVIGMDGKDFHDFDFGRM